jgi:predicted nucleic acid-binding protein
VDTSFLVSLYVLDANSARAAALMKRVRFPVFLMPLGELELTNAILLRLFRKEMAASKAKSALALVRADIESGIFSLRPLPAGTYERAKQIARRWSSSLGTRTLDILHVASAMMVRAEAFYTFDLVQGKLARAEGLKVAQV